MKTSNYILIAFFTFLFGGTFVLFLTAKIYNKTDNSITWTCEEKKLEPFSVVVAEPGADFSLQIECHDPIIRCAHPPKEASVFPPFTVRNDTLFVSALATETEVRTPRVTETEVRTLSVTVRSIKSVIAKEKSMRLWDVLLNAATEMPGNRSNSNIESFMYMVKNWANQLTILNAYDAAALVAKNSGILNIRVINTI